MSRSWHLGIKLEEKAYLVKLSASNIKPKAAYLCLCVYVDLDV